MEKRERYLKRIEKYENKISKNIIDEELRKRMLTNYASFCRLFFPVDELVNKILNKNGILSGEQRLFYYAFARELWRIKNKYQGKTAKREIRIILDKWFKRKLKKEVLLKIKNGLKNLSFPG